MRELESLASRAGPAIENARRFREARHLADLDALTGLHNRRFFHETLAREVARAHRYERQLALIVFDLDDFKEVNDKIGHLAGDSVLAEVAERMRTVVRSADIACRVGGDEFGVIIPESTLEDADQLYPRAKALAFARIEATAPAEHRLRGLAPARAPAARASGLGPAVSRVRPTGACAARPPGRARCACDVLPARDDRGELSRARARG